jgi:26S proteasome regulatory subunit N9
MSAPSAAALVATAMEHCETMSRTYPELAEAYQSMSVFVQDKLYHQFTVLLLEFVSNPAANARITADQGHSFFSLYHQVVAAVETKLNPLSLARIAVSVSTVIADPVASRTILETLMEKLQTKISAGNASSNLEEMAVVYLQAKLALWILQNDPDRATALENVKEQIRRQTKQLADTTSVVPAVVNAAHYEQNMAYFKLQGPPHEFLGQALAFLNYAPLTGALDAFYETLAVDICLAALTGQGVYHNLEQVIQNPLLQTWYSKYQSTKASPVWLYELLQCVSDGNIALFERLTNETYPQEILTQPALVHHATAVREKLTLLALVHYFMMQDNAAARTFGFEEVARHCQLEVNQVEWILMRALSVHLVKGHMDQVEQTVTITWIQPRILNEQQLQALAQRFSEWSRVVSTTHGALQQQTISF